MNGHGPAQQHTVNGVQSPAAWSREPMHGGSGTADDGSTANGKLQNGAAAAAEPRLFGDNADDFLCGTAISVYQNSGGPDSNWGEYEDRHKWYSRTIAVGCLSWIDEYAGAADPHAQHAAMTSACCSAYARAGCPTSCERITSVAGSHVILLLQRRWHVGQCVECLCPSVCRQRDACSGAERRQVRHVQRLLEPVRCRH